MKRAWALALALIFLGAGDDPGAPARYFIGTWKCAGVTLTFAPFAESTTWTRLSYGGLNQRGTAILGFVAGLHGWVLRDFHANGAYADMNSPGPSDGRWQWTGPYYPQEGGPPLEARVTYVEVSPTRFDRTFEYLRDQDFVPTGSDTCSKVIS